jgi:hypothetical protein
VSGCRVSVPRFRRDAFGAWRRGYASSILKPGLTIQSLYRKLLAENRTLERGRVNHEQAVGGVLSS